MTNYLGVLLLSGQLVACGSDAGDGLLFDGPLGPDPVPPPAQGASVFSLQATSPAASDKTCPVASSTTAIPEVAGAKALSEDTYEERVIDGKDGVALRCSVSGASTFTFEGAMVQGGRSFKLSNGVLSVDKKGSADIALVDSRLLSSSLVSSTPCAVEAAKAPGNNFQVKPGSIWAKFECAAVEAASDACEASGFFVFENCGR